MGWPYWIGHVWPHLGVSIRADNTGLAVRPSARMIQLENRLALELDAFWADLVCLSVSPHDVTRQPFVLGVGRIYGSPFWAGHVCPFVWSYRVGHGRYVKGVYCKTILLNFFLSADMARVGQAR